MSRNEKLSRAYAANKFEPSIRHIRFPHFKNLSPMLRLDFKFPITAIVGPNGSNKSSVLRAIGCCPHGNDLGDHWFSTQIDPITESGGRPRYIFGYLEEHSRNIVEVINTRIHKKQDPDYWEPSRPILKDGMEKMPPIAPGAPLKGRTKTRWAGIEKNMVLLDFRSEISAFDKLFYHGEISEKIRRETRKQTLRKKSKILKKVIDENLNELSPYKGKKNLVFSNKHLPEAQVAKISEILGRRYQSIRLINHNIFENRSYTAILKANDLQYSEAFAGSGEFAVVMLVHKIMSAPDCSLIILDEPEVSLHPGAQIKLMQFMSDVCLQNKHQVFIGTHSKYIVDGLPPEAIILLQPDPATGKITAQQDILPSEAFFHLGLPDTDKRRVFVEDRLGAELVNKALRTLGEAAFNRIEVKPYPGGAQTILSQLGPSLMQIGDNTSVFLLDGDQKPLEEVLDPDIIPEAEHEKIQSELYKLTKVDSKNIRFALNGGDDPALPDIRKALERDYLKYAKSRTYYLPSANPETFVWENMPDDNIKELCDNQSVKCRFEEMTRMEKGRMPYESITSDEIFETQTRRLALINQEHQEIIRIANILRDL